MSQSDDKPRVSPCFTLFGIDAKHWTPLPYEELNALARNLGLTDGDYRLLVYYASLDWDRDGLVIRSDIEVARELGVERLTIFRRRQKLKLLALIDWNASGRRLDGGKEIVIDLSGLKQTLHEDP